MSFETEILKLIDEGFLIEEYDDSYLLDNPISTKKEALNILSRVNNLVILWHKEWYDDYEFGVIGKFCTIHKNNNYISEISKLKELTNTRKEIIKSIEGGSFEKEFDKYKKDLFIKFKSEKIKEYKNKVSIDGFHDDEDWDNTITWAMGG